MPRARFRIHWARSYTDRCEKAIRSHTGMPWRAHYWFYGKTNEHHNIHDNKRRFNDNFWNHIVETRNHWSTETVCAARQWFFYYRFCGVVFITATAGQYDCLFWRCSTSYRDAYIHCHDVNRFKTYLFHWEIKKVGEIRSWF